LALTILATTAVVVALEWAQGFLIPLLIGILLAYTLNPLIVWLELIRVPRAVGASLVMLAVVCALVFGTYSLRGQMQAIIEQLQIDGRKSYSDIGRAVELSEAAVRQRVQRLTESGVMQIVAITDPLQMGFNRQAMIGIRTSGDARAVADELATIGAAEYVVLTAGSFDIMVEVVCNDDSDLLELLNGKIRTIPGVVDTEVFTYLQLKKQQYNWGTL
jgi:Lrp/AsnC family transcriptional regulator for asnA, asnC and gidA